MTVPPNPDAGEPRVRLVPTSPGPRSGPTLAVVVDDTPVAEARLAPADDTGAASCDLRLLPSAVPPDDAAVWSEVVAAFETYARDLGALALRTAVPAALAPMFDAAGHRATSTALSKQLAPVPGLQEDRRIEVRAMTLAEREQLARDLPRLLRDRETHGERLTHLVHLATAAPETELMLIGTLADRPVARVWATVEQHRDGTLDVVGRAVEIATHHRGQGLLPSLLGAVNRHIRTLGVRAVAVHVPDGGEPVTRAFLEAGFTVDDLLLRKDL